MADLRHLALLLGNAGQDHPRSLFVDSKPVFKFRFGGVKEQQEIF